MPLYEYECDACGEQFEVIRKFSDPPLDVCVRCGKSPVRRLVSSPAFQFKGTGWYITDYARKGEGGKGEPGKAEGDKADKTSTEKTQDTKSDAAAADKKADKGAKAGGKTETAPKTDAAAKSAAPAKTSTAKE